MKNLDSARTELGNVKSKAKKDNDFPVKDLEAKVREESNDEKLESTVAELNSILNDKHMLEEEVR